MTEPLPIPLETERLAEAAVDAAYKVHTELGPGLLESVYATCMCIELRSRGLIVLTEVQLPIFYQGHEIPGAFRIDLLINDDLTVEIKATEKDFPLHKAQLLTYLKLAKKRLGLLINFNIPFIRDGIKRIAL